LYKPAVAAPLSFWARVALAFSVFFRILSDARFAASVAAQQGGSEPEQPKGEPFEPNWPEAAATPGLGQGPDAGALVLLSLLQAEGRFVDFVQQDITAFPDAEVGAVARVVHTGCRKVLGTHLRIAAIRGEAEGQPVALEPGFDPNHIKLTGNVSGSGRLSGVLRHRGWQATEVHLPVVVDRAGTAVLAPAEVEL
jgi:hypothetical protein